MAGPRSLARWGSGFDNTVPSGTIYATIYSTEPGQNAYNLYVESSSAPAAPITCTLRVNGIDTALTATILAGQTTATNLVNSFALNLGDKMEMRVNNTDVGIVVIADILWD
jgi:hypothetical protein